MIKTPKQIMNAAKGRRCTLNTEYCSYDSETTVGCHLPDGTGGSNKLTGPLGVAFGCSNCHDAIDGRNIKALDDIAFDKEFYMRRGLMRTLRILHDDGLIKIRGIDY